MIFTGIYDNWTRDAFEDKIKMIKQLTYAQIEFNGTNFNLAVFNRDQNIRATNTNSSLTEFIKLYMVDTSFLFIFPIILLSFVFLLSFLQKLIELLQE